jgi:prepilin signal peptidase PulO-like enzyme (type II secretory pathway)
MIGIALLLCRRNSLSSYIPFGPYLAVAAVAYILGAPSILEHYLNPSILTTWWIATQS